MPGMEKPYLDHGVDIVYWGHFHVYERFYPIANNVNYRNGSDSDDPYHNSRAPIYITTGAAGNNGGLDQFENPPNPASAIR